MTFCDWFAGATQVKWNRQDSHILASSHNKFLRIWDDRKGASPLRSIEAHATKIYGVDWNRTETNNVATCSLDKTIKFWDYTSDSDKPERTIIAPFPVWRARHTPFGTGLLAMPQRDDFDLHLYDRRPCDQLQELHSMPMVHRFDGHEGQVKEFLWRARGSVEDSKDSRDFQLVSWGTDRVLRLHRVAQEISAKIGYVRGQRVKRTIPFTRKDAVYRSFRGEPSIGTKDTTSTDKRYRHDLDLLDNPGMSDFPHAGMSKTSDVGNAIWAGGESRSVTMAGKKNRSHDGSDAISWMRGVKIGKRETAQSGVDQSVSSVLSPSLKASQPWDSFDSLAEEITHLADTFRKTSTYLKCRIEIPPEYPAEAPPYPTVESTAGLDDETILQITSDLQVIGDTYQERERHSLEVMLRYLLREQTCQECLSLLQAVPDNSVLESDQLGGFSSSDDEDETGQQYAGIRAPGLESSDGMLAEARAQYRVPLPKACGALWADDGRLICFFPPKAEKALSFLRPLGSKPIEWSSKDRKNMFGGFGRLESASPDTKRTSSDLETIHSGDSDFDDSSQSSSGSSSSGDVGVSQVKWMPSIAWREALQGSKHAMSIDESHKSSGAHEPATSTTRGSKNFISIHDCAELLPAKRRLAVGYTLGSDTRCCLHNAAVARDNGEPDLADVWDLVNLVIQDEVPLERMAVTGGPESILIVARRAFSPLRSKDSAIDLSYDSPDDEHQVKTKGRTRWGAHPFGRRWLVDALFDHFERVADVQMLSMLSCVLQCSPDMTDFRRVRASSPSKSDSHRNLEAPQWLSQGLFEHYFASPEVAASVLQPPLQQTSFSLDMQKPTSDPHSTSSSIGASTSNPLTPFLTGLTPPLSFNPSKVTHERSNSQMTISTSPEQFKHFHRSGSTLATAFAASLARPFSFSTPASSSPPTVQTRKRLSPATSYMATTTTNQALGASVTSKKSAFKLQGSKVWRPPPTLDTSRGDLDDKMGLFTTKLKNQDRFHNDGYASEPLLDPAKAGQYAAYRSLYASILFAWDLPMIGCQILQYNGSLLPRPAAQGQQDPDEGKSLITLGRDSAKKVLDGPDNLQLDLHQTCGNGHTTLPTGANVQMPSNLDQTTPSFPATNMMANEQEELGWHDVAEEAEISADGNWRDVAYESLARNLGGKFLTPKPSQIWRGGETRKASMTGVPQPRRSGSG
ncbi:MAG: hypothetical protein Q9218_004584 [Villophora microphyllina]